jgi:hypothetical protein
MLAERTQPQKTRAARPPDQALVRGAGVRGVAAARGGVELSVPLCAGHRADEIVLDAGHQERLFRTAAYVAVQAGVVAPDVEVRARLVPVRLRQRHEEVDCLESCGVEVLDPAGTALATVEFPRGTFAAYAVARALHLLGADGEADLGTRGAYTVGYALHARPAVGDPLLVARPRLVPVRLGALTRGAVVHGRPDDTWVATLLTASVMEDIATLAARSRAQGIEAAGRIHARVGYDPARRCFVRLLERLVPTAAADATALSVVSSAASWAPFLDGAPDEPTAPSAIHSHLHAVAPGGAEHSPSADHLLAEAAAETARSSRRVAARARVGLAMSVEPCISIADVITHYATFPDTLSASAIVSLFPDRAVLKIYGYTGHARLREEPGHFVVDDAVAEHFPTAPARTGGQRAPEAEGRR